MSKIRNVAAVSFCLTVVTLFAFFGTASADINAMGSVYQGDDYASSNGTWVEVCDMEADGDGVYGVFNLGSGGSATVRDTNGSKAGCGNDEFSKVTSFKVCENWNNLPDPCSSWARP